MWQKPALVCVFLVGLAVLCVAPPVRKDKKSDSKTDEGKGDPEYARYLKQVIEILENDDDYVKKLLNASEDELRTGKVAEDLDLVKHDVRTKLDELKRQEVERQRMIRRQMNDHLNGLKEREYWNPLFDDENPNFFGPEDFKKLLWKHHEEMDKQDKERREEFKKHEMEKEHKRKEHLNELDEKARKEEELRFEQLQQKHLNASKNIHHPGSKAQLEQVWEETDGLDAKDFDPRTFFKLHDTNGDDYLDTSELEALFVKEVDKLYDEKDEDFDPREKDEEIARMREHVMSEIDKDKDGFVSLEEFMKASRGDEFEKDEGWKTVEEEPGYTDEELAEFEKQLKEEEMKHQAAADAARNVKTSVEQVVKTVKDHTEGEQQKQEAAHDETQQQQQQQQQQETHHEQQQQEKQTP
ncbi:nucleobindin-2-like [Montipora capricornis]|uniref:nucleobindin-2-like n=1 Tax=Montipora capricornis TaxID=246305 RepID=UPI0035F19196